MSLKVQRTCQCRILRSEQRREKRASWKELRLVMEFLGGGSMDDVLGMRRFLPETQAGLLTWCLDVLCQAVSTVNMSGFGRLPANC